MISPMTMLIFKLQQEYVTGDRFSVEFLERRREE